MAFTPGTAGFGQSTLENVTTNLSALSTATTAATALNDLILVTPQVQSSYTAQLNGLITTSMDPAQLNTGPTFVFHYEGEQTVQVDSDITDHYVEDNTAVQDHIAVRPTQITTNGFIGELNDVVPSALRTIQTQEIRLQLLGAYAPILSETATIAFNTAFQVYQLAQNVSNSVNAYASLSLLNGQSTANTLVTSSGVVGFNATTGKVPGYQTKQAAAFIQFYGYIQNRYLFTVQTPWAIFQNMAILRYKSVQTAESVMFSNFEITFKQIRVASNQTVVPKKVVLGRLASQSAAQSATTGVLNPSTSSLAGIISGITGSH